jgi:NAD(P)-dependent dehydrogenase (short-subunit alcohol dehydrogenase family)
MQHLFDLTGQTAIVTGASSGLGAHFAKTLAAAGAKVAIGARRTDRLEELAAEITAAGGRALPVALDVTDADSIAEAVRIAAEELGPITILINNAGVPSMARALDMDEEEWDRVVGTNLKGAWLTAREVGRHMMKLGHGGNIVNIASILGQTAGRRALSYSASKAGVIAMTQNMALELGDAGIRVNAIAPGYVVTDLNRDFLLGKGGDRIRSRVPLGRFGEPEDLDAILLMLAGRGASYTTGAVFTVDGGLTLSTL